MTCLILGRERLRQTARFLAIRRHGQWVRGRQLHVGVLPNHLPVVRLGLRVQRGVSTAVERNRAKRVLREAYRRESAHLAHGHDILVILVKQEHYRVNPMAIELRNAFHRLGIVSQ